MTTERNALGRTHRSLPALILFGVLVCGGVWLQRFGVTERAAEPERWLPVQPRTIDHEVGLVGKIEPGTVVTLTAPFEGELQAYLVEPGQRVERGQPLAVMDPALLEGQLREALAAQLVARQNFQQLSTWSSGNPVLRARRVVRVAQMALDTSQRKLRESEALFDRGIIARAELEDLRQQAQMQQFEVVAAKEELQQVLAQGAQEQLLIAEMELTNATLRHEALQKMLANQEVVAPFDGIVMPVEAGHSAAGASPVVLHKGSKVAHGQALLALANTERLRVASRASELDINRIQVGQTVRISGDGFDARLAGRVDWVSTLALAQDEAGAGAQFPFSVLVEASAEPYRQVRLGMSARLVIVTDSMPSAVVVAPEAIRWVDGAMTVEHRPSMDAPVQRVAVTTGRSTPEGIEVLGLPPGLIRSTP